MPRARGRPSPTFTDVDAAALALAPPGTNPEVQVAITQAFEVGAVVPEGKTGRIPGLTIIRSPHRDAIDDLLFEQRLPLATISRTIRERYGVVASPMVLKNYAKYMREMMSLGRKPVGGRTQIMVEQVEKAIAANWNFLTKYVKQSQNMLDNNALEIEAKTAIAAIKQMQAMLGSDQSPVEIMTSVDRYHDALEAILRIVMESVTPAQRTEIAEKIRRDPVVMAVMEQRSAIEDDGDGEEGPESIEDVIEGAFARA